MKTIEILWSKCVRMETGPYCIKCGQLGSEAHHIFKRSLFPEHKYDADFGVCVCSVCHPELDRTKPDVVLDLIELRFPPRAARVREKTQKIPAGCTFTICRPTEKEQRATLRSRIKTAQKNWMDLECCDVER